MLGDGEEGRSEDSSPFLSKAGWLRQLNGYSWHTLIQMTMPPNESYLQKVPKLAEEYFRSVSQVEVARLVHPIYTLFKISRKFKGAYSVGDKQRQATVEDVKGYKALKIMPICLDELWKPLCAMMERVTLTVFAPALIFESTSRLEAENT